MGILVNKAITPDGTILYSRHRHDFVSHKDANGSTYALDGGLAYVKTMGELELLTITTKDSIGKIREEMEWGSYGVNGDEDLHYILLKDMTNDHINAVAVLSDINEGYREAFKRELEYRWNKGIHI